MGILSDICSMSSDGEVKLADGFSKMIESGDVYALKVKGDRFDAWSKSGFIKATIYQALKNSEVQEEITAFIKKLGL